MITVLERPWGAGGGIIPPIPPEGPPRPDPIPPPLPGPVPEPPHPVPPGPAPVPGPEPLPPPPQAAFKRGLALGLNPGGICRAQDPFAPRGAPPAREAFQSSPRAG
jgi:hypothetical protein